MTLVIDRGQLINDSTVQLGLPVGLTVPGRPWTMGRHEVRHIIASRDEARPHALAADERDAHPYLDPFTGSFPCPYFLPLKRLSRPKKNPGLLAEPGSRVEAGTT